MVSLVGDQWILLDITGKWQSIYIMAPFMHKSIMHNQQKVKVQYPIYVHA